MKCHKFTVTIPEGMTPASIIAAVKKEVKGFSGNEKSGSFNGSGVVGSYECDGTEIDITLTAKPFMVSWNYVEKEIRGYFS